MTALRTILTNTPYLTLALIFTTNSLLESTWIVYIPYITEKLNIGAALLGTALFCKAVGAFSAMPFSPALIRILGEGRLTFITAILFCLTIPLLVVMPNYWSLCLCLYFAGVFGGTMDISMNALVSKKEKEDGVYIMSATHGFWSLGGMVGASTASFIAASAIPPFWHIAILSGLLILMQLFIARNYFHLTSNYVKTRMDFSKIKLPVILLATICLVIMMGEGIIADWSSLYLKNVTLARASLYGLGFAGFSAAMAFGRFNADRISANFGARTLIIGGFLIALLGLLLVLTATTAWTIPGFTIMGLGFSGIIPELFRLSAKIEGLTPAQGITLVAGIGYFGFLIGPVAFGYIAEGFGLRMSFLGFWGVLVACLGGFWMLGRS